MNLKKSAFLAAVSLALLSAPAVQAKTLKYASGFPPGGSVSQGLNEFADYVGQNSDLKIRMFELSLLDLKETPPGVRDGMADMGYVLTPYYPVEYSETNLVSDLSMLATTGDRVAAPGAVMAGVVTEYVMLHCDSCQEQFKKENQVFLGAIGTPEYIQLCNTPIRDVDDIKGKKMRASMDVTGRWAEHFGGTKVSIPANDLFEALSQGVVDCVMISAPELRNLQLFDVVKHITLALPGGVFSGVGAANTNLDTWKSLTEAQRESLFKAAAFNSAVITVKYQLAAQKDIDEAASRGVEIIEPSQAMIDATNAFVKDDIATIKRNFEKDYKLKDVEQKVEIITKLVDKWKGITRDIYDDTDAMTKAFNDEIFSKVDPKTYGMH